MFSDSCIDRNIPERKEEVACVRMTIMLYCAQTKYFVMPGIVMYIELHDTYLVHFMYLAMPLLFDTKIIIMLFHF